MKNVSPWAGFRNFTLRYWSDIDANSDANSRHRNRVTINNWETGAVLFETNMKLGNMRFEMIKTWEGVASHKKSHNERLLLKNLSERVLFNKLHEYLYTAKIHSSEFDCLRAKKVKRFFIYIYIVLLLAILCFNCLQVMILPAQLFFTTD